MFERIMSGIFSRIIEILLALIIILVVIGFIITIVYASWRLFVETIKFLFKWHIRFVNKRLEILPIPMSKDYNLITRFWHCFFTFVKWGEVNTIIVVVDNNGDEETFAIKRSEKNIDKHIIQYKAKTFQIVTAPNYDKKTNLPVYRINLQQSKTLQINYDGLTKEDKVSIPPESLTALIDGNFLTKLLNLGGINIMQACLYAGGGIACYVIMQPILSAVAVRIISGGQGT